MTATTASTGAPHGRRWPATLTVVVILVLTLAMPAQVASGPRWLIPAVEVALLAPILINNPVRLSRDSVWLRRSAVALTALLAVANTVFLARMVALVLSGAKTDPRVLVQAAVLIWVTNVAATALALWEMDRGGPFARDPHHHRVPAQPDLLFPQMTGAPGWDAATWRPSFTDYLFTAFTAATAFSPTDTMPLSARAKWMMTATSTVSLVTIALVAARAVNVL